MAPLAGTLVAQVSGATPQPAASRQHGRARGLRIRAQADRPRHRDGSRWSGGGRGQDNSRRPKTYVSESGMTLKQYIASDGVEHLGSALQRRRNKPFPGPPSGDSGPPLRILPIGGLGEIGMNCMLAGVRDRYVVIDAGLMFPDFTDLGMQKILPDTDFLAQWKDRIEALIITHGHEDHIGALPWVVPALDPSTPIYASAFVLELIKKRLSEYNLWDERRFHKIEMRQRFQAGPFEIEPVRVTHSIPDCCGLIMRSSEGTIVHTGDWKIDEQPLDGENFDRELFEALGSESVALMMSDSTNVLSPGRTLSEQVVHNSIVEKVLEHNGKGRVVCTQFASNLHRLYGVKRAADAAGRKVCFVGASLSHYLEAAWKVGRAPFDPKELLDPAQLRNTNPNEVLIVTTGSQGEEKAQLSMAARESSRMLKMLPNDLLLYSAKVIPGNEGKVTKMLNALATQGVRIRQGRNDNLHTSGHAYQEELVELLQSVRPQTFLPVHGEYAFLTEHALLARERAGVNFVEVIRNGEMLAVRERRNRNTVSVGSMAASQVAAGRGGRDDRDDDPIVVKFDGPEPTYFFNDGGKGTGTREEMEIGMRTTLATEGIIVLGLDVRRSGMGEGGLAVGVRVTTRGLWTDDGRLLQSLTEAVEEVCVRLPGATPLAQVEREAIRAAGRRAGIFNDKKPEVIAIAYEYDPRNAHMPAAAAARSGGRSAAAAPPAAPGAATLTPRRPAPWGPGAPGGASARGLMPPPPLPYGGPQQRQPLRPQGPAAPPGRGRASQEVEEEDEEADLGALDLPPAAAAAAGAGGGGAAAGAEGDSKLTQMLRARQEAAVARKAAAAAAAAAALDADGGGGGGGGGPPPLRVLDPKFIQERRRRNPRDQPSQIADPDFG